MIFLGVDPGINGGLVSLSANSKLITISDFASVNKRIDPNNIGNILSAIKDYHEDNFIICCLEKSHSMSNQGVTSTFNYGVTYGIIYASLILSGARIYEISPQKWKKMFDLNSNKKLGIIKGKEDAVDIAIDLFPSKTHMFKRMTTRSKKGYVIYDGRADATLIAEYCRRTYK